MVHPKNRKKSKYDTYEVAPSDAVYFLFDVETTGGKRNYDKIIAISFLAYNESGTLLGSFSRMINPGEVMIVSYLSKNVHSKCVVCALYFVYSHVYAMLICFACYTHVCVC